ncbi:MAG: NAD-dependent epimerase/dehydratase family protein [Bacteroidetes bacterium]|nr:NAD-dependent epimerase/dehydratase family protein [Bacteroidota bacterium]
MRKILVTGGSGFVGSALAEKLLGDPDNYVVVVDNLLTGTKDRLPVGDPSRFQFIKCDVNVLNDILPVMVSFSFDYVFHYAAVVGVQRTLDNPGMVLEDIQGIKNILDLCKSTGVKRVFYSSSSEVYGEPVEFPQNEHTTPLNSKLPYAVVKNVGESFCRSYKQEFDLDYTIFRFFNTYGPKQSSDFVMSRFIHRALNNDPIPVYGDGSQTRTFCYIDDNIDACVSTLYEDLAINEVVNIGNDHEISIRELAETVIAVTSSRSEIVHRPALEEGDMRRRKPDITKMRMLLDRELIDLRTGIERVVSSPRFRRKVTSDAFA